MGIFGFRTCVSSRKMFNPPVKLFLVTYVINRTYIWVFSSTRAASTLSKQQRPFHCEPQSTARKRLDVSSFGVMQHMCPYLAVRHESACEGNALLTCEKSYFCYSQYIFMEISIKSKALLRNPTFMQDPPHFAACNLQFNNYVERCWKQYSNFYRQPMELIRAGITMEHMNKLKRKLK